MAPVPRSLPRSAPAAPRGAVPVTVHRTVQAPPAVALVLLAGVDLPAVFTGYGPLPAVTGTRGQEGAWDVPGRTRTVELADGSTLEEVLRAYGDDGFGYLVHSPSGPLRHLVHDAEVRWQLAPAGPGATAVAFTYAFRPRTLRRPLVAAVLAPVWRRYATRALALAAERVEAQHRRGR